VDENCLKVVVGTIALAISAAAALMVRWREASSFLVRDEAKAEVKAIGEALAESAEAVEDLVDSNRTAELIGEHLAQHGRLDAGLLVEEAIRIEDEETA